MNAPKKPGTDLNALKARLAKKDAPAPAAPAPAAAAPAPAAAAKAAPPRPGVKKPPPADPGFIPAPGEQAPPPMDIPAPGEQSIPMDIPAPGEVAQPKPAAQPVAAAVPAAKKQLQVNPDAAPFGADVGGGFDPNAGVIGGGDVGDVAQRGNKGLIALAAGAALLLGVVIGYLGNQINSKGALVKQGKDKGAVMLEETTKVVSMRTDISTKMLDIAKKIFENPAEAAKALDEINKAAFEQTPNVEALFGWQLAAVHPDGIKKTFQLYNEASGLRTDLGYLTGFVTNNVPSLSLGGPRVLAVMNKDKGAVLVERVEAQCGDPKAPTACGQGKEGDAIGWTVRDVPGGNPTFAALGTGENQIQVLLPEGGVYGAVVGSNPEANAKNTAMLLLARVNERLEAMNKAEKRALKALKKYSDDPNIDSPSGELDD